MSVWLIWEILYWGWVGSEIYLAVATNTERSGGKVRDRGSQALLWIVIVVAMTAGEWIRHMVPLNMLGGAHWLRVAGVILLAIALSIRWVAIRTLGKAFSANVAIKDSQQICRAGMYRFLRHPSYLGLVLVFFAVGVHSRNWTSFVIEVVPTTAAVMYRIQVEEAALREAFGEEYAAYSRETKRLIPGVY
jgi:protein-S-isoprenylcysteine O-methyltransferase